MLGVLLLQDVQTDIDTLPASVQLSSGELHVTFKTVDQLAETLMHLAVFLDKQLDDFIMAQAITAAPVVPALLLSRSGMFRQRLAPGWPRPKQLVGQKSKKPPSRRNINPGPFGVFRD
jgi:hypothetical protein